MSVGVGITLAPNRDFLDRVAPIVEGLVDYVEITPELSWGHDGVSDFFADVQQRSGLPFVAHGVGLSLGTPGPPDPAHLDRIARDHERFDFRWYSEHLGFWRAGERSVALALPLPHTREAVAVVAGNLAAMAQVVPHVAFENWAGFFAADTAADDPGFFRAIADESGASMLLDLHNVQTHCHNTGTDPDAYVDAIDCSRVVEIHIAGGDWSNPVWTPSGRVFRLDGHDGPVTDWQWTTLARVLPRCGSLQGVTLERLPHTLEAAHVPGFVAEFERLRSLVAETRPGPAVTPMAPSCREEGEDLMAWERAVLDSLDGTPRVDLDPDGLRLTGRIVQKLRFQRLCTDPELARWFESDPQAFVEAFRAYHRAVPPRFVWAADEVAAFRRRLGDRLA